LQAAGTLPAGAWWALGPAAAPALAAGALRMARRRPVDHSMPVIDTPGGAVPTGPLIWAATGVDLALLGSLPALAALASRARLGGAVRRGAGDRRSRGARRLRPQVRPESRRLGPVSKSSHSRADGFETGKTPLIL
ncbi:hypothetical protein B1L11_37450, partial [Microbispora sp. GKU 823]